MSWKESMFSKSFYFLLLVALIFLARGYTEKPEEAGYSTGRVEIPSSLADNPTKREQLKYLASCALAEETEVYTTVEGEEYSFEGSIGLAPQWIDRGLVGEEERWVSACMLARTNFFGKTVQISMRAPEGIEVPSKSLETTPEEIEGFSIFEGGFFGNLFAENPVAYTCLGDRTAEENADPILQDRVCTEETDAYDAKERLSNCRFIITGQCSDPESFKVGDEVYKEVIFVYLKPKK